MKYRFCYIIFFITFIPAAVVGQNLVMNPSFESFSSCPLGPSEFENATNWQNPFQNFLGDTCSTSDLYASCSPFGAFGVGVPDNIMGSQPAHTGEAYAGIIVYEGFALTGCTSLFGSSWREYVEGQLSSPLQAGQTYCVSFWISLADNVKWATDDIAVYFSNSLVDVSCGTVSNSVLQVTPQLEYSGADLDNVNDWVELQWSYTATGGEQHIVIGNFKDDNNTSYSCANSSAFNPYSYYFIDDVSVELGDCSAECALSVDLETDQEDCVEGGTATITATASNGTGSYSYDWGSATGQTLGPVSNGTYTVTVVDNGMAACSTSATVVVEILDPVIAEAGVNDTICKGDVGQLVASGGVSYAWDQGTQTALLEVGPGATTTFEVTVTGSNGCTDTDSATIVVYDIPAANIEQDSALVCSDSGPMMLTGTPLGGVFEGPGMSGNMFYPSVAGMGTHTVYYYAGEYEECLGVDAIVITVDLCTGIESPKGESDFAIYPNPATSELVIELFNSISRETVIHNMLGDVVFSEKLNGRKVIDLSSWPAGVYSVSVISEGMRRQVKKLTITQ